MVGTLDRDELSRLIGRDRSRDRRRRGLHGVSRRTHLGLFGRRLGLTLGRHARRCDPGDHRGPRAVGRRLCRDRHGPPDLDVGRENDFRAQRVSQHLAVRLADHDRLTGLVLDDFTRDRDDLRIVGALDGRLFCRHLLSQQERGGSGGRDRQEKAAPFHQVLLLPRGQSGELGRRPRHAEKRCPAPCGASCRCRMNQAAVFFVFFACDAAGYETTVVTLSPWSVFVYPTFTRSPTLIVPFVATFTSRSKL